MVCAATSLKQGTARIKNRGLSAARSAYQSESSSYTDNSESSTVPGTPEPSQILDAACIRSGLGYTRWLGEYVNGTVLVFGAYSLRELKFEPYENCHIRGLACVELTKLDPFHGELTKNSCCGWCISEGGTEVSDDQRRQRSEAAVRQKHYEIAKAADIAMMNDDNRRRLFRFLLPSDGLSRYAIQKFLEEEFSKKIVVNSTQVSEPYPT